MCLVFTATGQEKRRGHKQRRRHENKEEELAELKRLTQSRQLVDRPPIFQLHGEQDAAPRQRHPVDRRLPADAKKGDKAGQQLGHGQTEHH